MRGIVTAEVLLGFLAAYGAAGVITASAFALAGAGRLAQGARVSVAARLLLMPAAAALWPVVLRRWRLATRP